MSANVMLRGGVKHTPENPAPFSTSDVRATLQSPRFGLTVSASPIGDHGLAACAAPAPTRAVTTANAAPNLRAIVFMPYSFVLRCRNNGEQARRTSPAGS